MDTRYLYLLRHGSVSNKKRLTRRPKDGSELVDLGRYQSAKAANKLPDDISQIFSSPFARAYQTAEIVSEKKGLSYSVQHELREIDRPKFTQGARFDLPDHIEYMVRRKEALYQNDFYWKFDPFCESHAEFYRRMLKRRFWLEEPQFEGKKLCLVGHSNAWAMLRSVLLHPVLSFTNGVADDPALANSIMETFKSITLPHGGIALLTYDSSKKWSLLYSDKTEKK